MPAQIFTARIEKASIQTEINHSDQIQHPTREETGEDLIAYCNSLPPKNSYHARSVNIKATCAVELGINVLDGSSEDAILDRLAVVNEDGESFTEVLGRIALDFETNGNGFLEVVRGRGGFVEELYFMPASHTYRKPRGSQYQYHYRGETKNIDMAAFKPGDRKNEHSVVHFRQRTSLNRHYGVPDWIGVTPEIELDNAANIYSQAFFANSGVPDLAIIVEGGEFDEDTQKKVVAFVQQNFKGASNAHRVLYLPINDAMVKVRFERLGPNNAWQAPLEHIRTSCRDRIMSAHGVPPRLMGVVASGQLGGASEGENQLKLFQETCIEPRQKYFLAKLHPILRDMGIEATIGFERLSTETTGEKISDLYVNDIITDTEARTMLGWGEKSEGKFYSQKIGPEVPDGIVTKTRGDVVILNRINKLQEAIL